MKQCFDIRSPKQKLPKWSKQEIPALLFLPVPEEKTGISKKKNYFRISAGATLAIFLIVIGFYGLNVWDFQNTAKNFGPSVYEQFKSAAGSLMSLDLDQAKRSFEEANQGIVSLNNEANKYGLANIAKLIGEVIPYFKSVPAVLKNLQQLGANTISLGEDLEFLQNNLLGLILNQRGSEITAALENLKNRVSEISQLVNDMRYNVANLNGVFGQDFDSISQRLQKAVTFLDALSSWINVARNRHLLVLFQNPSEIRPGGGFAGSYAHIVLSRGSLSKMDVKDIYYPDGQLDIKVIPPKPLQIITTRWGARDANWFFDFSASAKKVIQFLEASKVYQDQLVKFSGAVAVNIEVLKDVLGVIGPIELKDYKLTLNSQNILKEIQREVEAGKDKAKGEPKKILQILTPIIFEKLAQLSDENKKSLLLKLKDRFVQKDIMVYFKDAALEDYFKDIGVAGDAANLSNNFWGSYLAVVNANIGGGKSDAFMNQKIQLVSTISLDGRIQNEVAVERTHSGQNQKEWWYKAANKNYIQLLAPLGARLLEVSGGSEKLIKPPIDYKTSKYSTDSDLAEMEKNSVMFGKTIFARWFNVAAGDTGYLKVKYLNPGAAQIVDGMVYQFIFDKQSGVRGSLEFEVAAPEGYLWEESGSKIYKYFTDNPVARVVLNLKLVSQ